MTKNNIISFLLLLSFLSACHKDDIRESEQKILPPTTLILQETIGDVLGYVYDQENKPVSGATIQINTQTTTTDIYGVFRFKQIKLDLHGSYVKIDKADFIAGSDYIYPANGLMYSYTQLFALDNNKKFDANTGGTIKIDGGGEINFPANSIMGEDGKNFDGEVHVTAIRIAADDPKIGDKMPGSLRGEDNDLNTVVLSTYGMVGIELRSTDGDELNLQNGKNAHVSFPIADHQKDIAPNEIPLWYFDEFLGIWKEEGKAIRVEDHYEAELAHFSWWNCDAPFPLVHMCTKVLFEGGLAAKGYEVRISVDNSLTRSGYVNDEGIVCGKIPKGKAFTIEVINSACGEKVREFEVGPFDNDVELDDIILDLPESLGNGKVECNGDARGNTTALLKYTVETIENTFLIFVDSDGNFDLDFATLSCDNVTEAHIFAYDPISGDASSPTVLDIDITNNNVVLNICNNCSFEAEITTSYSDSCDLSTNTISLTMNPVGTYVYEWDNGSTGNSIIPTEIGTYCVTVNPEGQNCPIIKCKEITSITNLDLAFELAESPYCGKNNGVIHAYASGGVGAYTYEITGSNGYISTENTVEDLEAGTYTVIVTDENNCTKKIEMTLTNQLGFDVQILQSSDGCENTFLSTYTTGYVTDPSALTYMWSNGETGKDINLTFVTGEYCVTVTESAGCVSVACIDVFYEPFEIFEDSCYFNMYYFHSYTFPYNVIPDIGTIFNHDQMNLSYDVLTFGYHFTAIPNSEQCQVDVYLPYYNGSIVTTSTHTTCDTCNDGQITINSVGDQNCRDCTFGTIKIYNVNDLNTELTTENDNMELPAGEYYVVALDQNTDCIIKHERITIE